jgi:hypothetical protein
LEKNNWWDSYVCRPKRREKAIQTRRVSYLTSYSRFHISRVSGSGTLPLSDEREGEACCVQTQPPPTPALITASSRQKLLEALRLRPRSRSPAADRYASLILHRSARRGGTGTMLAAVSRGCSSRLASPLSPSGYSAAAAAAAASSLVQNPMILRAPPSGDDAQLGAISETGNRHTATPCSSSGGSRWVSEFRATCCFSDSCHRSMSCLGASSVGD